MPERIDSRRQGAPAPSFGWQHMSGFGCFGKPETLMRMLSKVMEHVAHRDADAHGPCPAWPVGRAARRLMTRLSREAGAYGRPVMPAENRRERVAGFCIYQEGGHLRMCVYHHRKAMTTPSSG
jgi:hypothetical protein